LGLRRLICFVQHMTAVRAALVKTDQPVILCVDDDPTDLSLLTGILEENGFAVLKARDAADGLELFHRKPVSLVIIDQRLGGKKMTGAQMAREVKARKPDMPVVIRSGYPPPGVAQTWDVFINKGEPVEHFINMVKDLLKRYAA
jgi:CheY-like chemotaxis protein